jgi:hypothetical protein
MKKNTSMSMKIILTGAGALVLAIVIPGGAAFAQGTSDNGFAGYTVTLSGESTSSASMQFVLPAITCSSTATAVFPSVEIYKGKHYAVAGVREICSSKGVAKYQPEFRINGTRYLPTQPKNKKTAPGDTIEVSESQSASGGTATITDVTQGKQYVQALPGDTDAYGAAGTNSISKGSGVDPPANFGTITYQLVTFDGQALDSLPSVEWYWVDSSGNTEVSTSGLISSNSFSNTWVSSS